MTAATRVRTAVKGHGTENDFIVLPDLQATLALSPSLVVALCDRHAGIGADGVLRVVRTEAATEPDVRAQADEAEYFMDYRNADGSIAEMCGNGVRVFARYLQSVGLIGDEAVIATRGGPRGVNLSGDQVVVEMGRARPRPEQPLVMARFRGVALDMPNPHVVVELDSIAELEALDLSRPPELDRPLPEGQNVEFFVRLAAGRIRMRVHERGVGETRSCGTGICAAAVVAAGDARGDWQVEVPGGRCTVSWDQHGRVLLAGPAVLVAELSLTPAWLAAHR
jgi:diaminopimelate epimerase